MDYATTYQQDFIELDANYKGVEDFVQQAALGQVKALIVNGPPGVGKSYAVKEYLDKYCPHNYKTISGHMTLLSLYTTLHYYKDKGRVVVLDDADEIFSKVDGLNILKSAMDSRPIRNIHWETSNGKGLSTMGLPTNFAFEGSVILVSNVGFGQSDRKQMAHLAALKDRSYILYVAPNGEESLFKQVCYMVLQRSLLRSYGFTKADELMLLDYVAANRKRLHTISLRTMVKLAEIYQFAPSNWRVLADQSLLKAVANV